MGESWKKFGVRESRKKEKKCRKGGEKAEKKERMEENCKKKKEKGLVCLGLFVGFYGISTSFG